MTSQAPAQPTRMPALFVGHGSPLNAIEENRWSLAFAELGGALPRPKAIVVVSAHWFGEGTRITSQSNPRTIHDFSGFPAALSAVQYPAPGDPKLAARVRALIQHAQEDHEWGLDHGSWSVLRRMYPEADVPVLQLSLDSRLTHRQHFELARALTELRGEGVLLLGSGNVTHNLRDAMARIRSGTPETPPWASAFDQEVARCFLEHDDQALTMLWESEQGRLAHPHPDHFLPLLYVLGITQPGEPVRFSSEGFDAGSLSMRSILVG